ncbi:hypothetical protein ABPG73_004679 [Tetrahymena malaccensis]
MYKEDYVYYIITKNTSDNNINDLEQQKQQSDQDNKDDEEINQDQQIFVPTFSNKKKISIEFEQQENTNQNNGVENQINENNFEKNNIQKYDQSIPIQINFEQKFQEKQNSSGNTFSEADSAIQGVICSQSKNIQKDLFSPTISQNTSFIKTTFNRRSNQFSQYAKEKMQTQKENNQIKLIKDLKAIHDSNNQQTIYDKIFDKNKIISHYEMQYAVLQSHKIQQQQIERFIEKSNKDEEISIIDQRILSSIKKCHQI